MAAPRGTDIRTAILDAATALLQSSTFDSITLALIAQKAGISKGTLYYYYSNKDDILFDITGRYLDSLAEDLMVWVDNAEKDTSLPRLIHYILERGAAPTYGNLRLYLIGAGVSGHDALRERYIERYGEFHRTLTEKIAERVPAADAGYITWLMLTAMDGVLVQRQLGNSSFDAESFLHKTASVITALCHSPEQDN